MPRELSSVRPRFQVTPPGISVPRSLAGDRTASQVRPVFVSTGVLHPDLCRGSAVIELGRTKVLVRVVGPRPVSYAAAVIAAHGAGAPPPGADAADAPEDEASALLTNTTTTIGLVNVTVTSCAFSTLERRTRSQLREDDAVLARTVRAAIEPAILREKFPKACIDIQVAVLEDDGGVLVAAINAATCALIDAGIEMKDMVVSCAAAVKTEQETSSVVLVDPVLAEENGLSGNSPLIAICYCPNLKMVSQISVQNFGSDKTETLMRQVVDVCIAGCQRIHDALRQKLLEKAGR